MMQRDRRPRGPQDGLAGTVESLQNIEVRKLRQMLRDGSDKSTLPWSTNWSAATVVTGFVIDAMRKMLSTRTGTPDASRTPKAPA